MMIGQHWLHIQIRVAAVVDEPGCIALMLSIQNILGLPATGQIGLV